MKPQRTVLKPELTALRRQGEVNARVLAGNVSFGSTTGNSDPEQNMECSKASGTTPGVANTEFAVTHVLGRIPVTFFGHTDNGGVLYKSLVTPWSKTQIFLKCTTATAGYSVVVI